MGYETHYFLQWIWHTGYQKPQFLLWFWCMMLQKQQFLQWIWHMTSTKHQFLQWLCDVEIKFWPAEVRRASAKIRPESVSPRDQTGVSKKMRFVYAKWLFFGSPQIFSRWQVSKIAFRLHGMASFFEKCHLAYAKHPLLKSLSRWAERRRRTWNHNVPAGRAPMSQASLRPPIQK